MYPKIESATTEQHQLWRVSCSMGFNREVLQTESGSIFGKVRVRVLTRQGPSAHEHVRTESLFCKQKTDFPFQFRFGQC